MDHLSAADFRVIFDSLPGLFVVIRADSEFTVAAASDAYLEAVSRQRDDVVGRSFFDVLPGFAREQDSDTVARLRASLQRVVATGAVDELTGQTFGVHRPQKPGDVHAQRHGSCVNVPVQSVNGDVLFVIHRASDESGFARDVTGREHAAEERERLIVESERQRRIYEAALSNTPDLVYVFDLDHRFTYANEALLRMWGMTREQALGKNCLELGYEPWHAEMHDREIEQVIATRLPIRGEVPFSGTQGRRIYDYIFVPVLGRDGSVVAVAGTTRDVTDRKQAEQEIREQAEQLRKSDRAKDEFIATLSHELRNPLAPLSNTLHMLRLAGNRDPGVAAAYATMERQINHLVRLVNDLLETSRISRGAFDLSTEVVELAMVVRNAIETSQPLVESAAHRLTVTLPDEPLLLVGDPVRLAQILANLLNNAAHYTDRGGEITMQARREGAFAVVSVRDTGIGIAPDALSHMFEMFSRGEHSSGRGQDGLGIGLALSRRLAEMHGGTLDAHSEGPGTGSEFIVRLPLAERAAADTPARDDTGATMPQSRILVVDDNRDAAESLRAVLECLGADVRVAISGADALAQFSTHDPDAVVLDIGMPGMDGYEVARRLRSGFPDSRAILIALSGWGQEEDRRKAHEAGFDHHLVKPADIDALRAVLARPEGDEPRD